MLGSALATLRHLDAFVVAICIGLPRPVEGYVHVVPFIMKKSIVVAFLV